MNNSKVLFTGTVLLLFGFLSSCTLSKNKGKESSTVTPPPPNIILLMGDDHGWDEVGYNGHPFVKTPVLDEMAANGLRFDRFYSGHPSCSPTRGSFITGRHPNRYGTFSPNWSIRPEEIGVASLLKKAGYASAHFGKWHLGPVKKDSPTSPGAMGFDEWLSHDNFFEMNPVLSRNGDAPQMIEGEGSKVIIDEAISFIQKSKQAKQPFLLLFGLVRLMNLTVPLSDDLALYENLPDSLNNTKVGLTSNETGKKVERSLRDVLQERYAEITAMDRSIGNLRNYLKENNLSANTLVWYCGDNGTPPSAARTGMTIRAQKGSLYEGGVLVPGVLEWPKVIVKPSVTKVNSVTSDFLPTLVELAGQPLPNRPLDGISLLPFIKNPELKREQSIFFWKFVPGDVFNDSAEPYINPTLQEGTTPLAKMMNGKYTRTFRNLIYVNVSENDYNGERTVLGDKYKLVLEGDSPNNSGFELYDMLNDPAETTNIADSHPDIVDRMNKELKGWQQSVLKSLTGADYK